MLCAKYEVGDGYSLSLSEPYQLLSIVEMLDVIVFSLLLRLQMF